MIGLLSTDATDLELDDDNDLKLYDDGLRFVSGVAGVVQAVRIRLRLYRGEWFMDRDAGVPYHQELLGSKFNAGAARAAFAAAILDVPGVAELLSLVVTLDPRTRRLTVTYEVRVAFDDLVTTAAGTVGIAP